MTGEIKLFDFSRTDWLSRRREQRDERATRPVVVGDRLVFFCALARCDDHFDVPADW